MNKLNKKIYKKGISSICVVILLILSIVPATGVSSSGALAYSSDKGVEFKLSPEKEIYDIDDEFSVEAEYKNDSGQECEFEAGIEYPEEDLELVEEKELKSFSLKPDDTIRLTYKFKVKKEISNPYEDIKLRVNEKEKKTIALYENRNRNYESPETGGKSDTTSFKVKKIWSDGNEKHEYDIIYVNLLRNGIKCGEAMINQAKNWEHTFKSLPVSDDSGKPYDYKIQEQEFKGYDTVYGPVETRGGSTTGKTSYKWIDYDEIQSSDEIVMVISNYNGSYIISAGGKYFDCKKSAEFKKDDPSVLTNPSLSNNSIWKIEKDSDEFTAYNKGSRSYLSEKLKGRYEKDKYTYMKYNYDHTVKFTKERKYLYIDGRELDTDKRRGSKVRFYKKETETNTSPKTYEQTITNTKVSIKKQIDALKDNEKGINKNPDTDLKGKDDYRLYLDASLGAREKAIDVLLVVDNTYSMTKRDYYYNGGYRERQEVANELVNGTSHANSYYDKSEGIISQIMNLNPQNKVGLITFCGPDPEEDWKGLIFPDNEDNFTEVALKWTSLSERGINGVPSVDVSNKGGTGTNYMSGLLRANEYFSDPKVRDDGNDKYMIFISDGRANDRMKPLGGNRYEYVRDEKGDDVGFYRRFFVENNPRVTSFFIGIKDTGDKYPELEQMGKVSGGRYYSAENGDKLAEALSHIKESLHPTDVKITDELSQYVNLNLDKPDLKVERTYKDQYGQEQTEVVWQHNTSIDARGGTLGDKPYYYATDCVEYVRYTPSDDDKSTGKIELKLKEGYKIGNDSKFTISYNVKVNKTAKRELREKQGKYTDKGDLDTDFAKNNTSSNKEGFFANKEAYVEYKIAKDLKKNMYKKPVVQTSLDIGFTKLDQLDESKTLKGAKFKCFKATGSSNTPVTSWTQVAKFGEEITSGEDGKFELKDIEEGSYILEETKAPPGYELNQGANKWYISYSRNDGIKVFDSKGDEFNENNKFPYNSIKNNNYCIVNSKSHELPKAGGIGSHVFYLTGSFILLISIIGLRRKNAA